MTYELLTVSSDTVISNLYQFTDW